MNGEQENSLHTPLEEPVAVVRNDAMIGQGVDAFRLGRRVVLTSLGLAALGVDELQQLFQRSVERGEMVQRDAQKTISGLRRQATDGTTSAISSRVATLLNKVPGVSIAYKAPPEVQSPAEGAVVTKEDAKQ